MRNFIRTAIVCLALVSNQNALANETVRKLQACLAEMPLQDGFAKTMIGGKEAIFLPDGGFQSPTPPSEKLLIFEGMIYQVSIKGKDITVPPPQGALWKPGAPQRYSLELAVPGVSGKQLVTYTRYRTSTGNITAGAAIQISEDFRTAAFSGPPREVDKLVMPEALNRKTEVRAATDEAEVNALTRYVAAIIDYQNDSLNGRFRGQNPGRSLATISETSDYPWTPEQKELKKTAFNNWLESNSSACHQIPELRRPMALMAGQHSAACSQRGDIRPLREAGCVGPAYLLEGITDSPAKCSLFPTMNSQERADYFKELTDSCGGELRRFEDYIGGLPRRATVDKVPAAWTAPDSRCREHCSTAIQNYIERVKAAAPEAADPAASSR
ncbi:MAG: hypothetical protein ABL958_07665 [Bdellovibrionia bacterium]